MFIHYRTSAIILKKEDWEEADQLLTVYTRDFGKLEVLAKAIRKISSKLRPGAEIFSLSEIEFIQGKTHKTLTDAILIEKFGNLKDNLNKLRIVYKISQLLDDLVSDHEPDEGIWQLLIETLGKLDKLEVDNLKLELLYYYFFWNLVSLLGYQPEIKDCTIQGKEINCEIVKIIKVILRKDWQILPRLKIEPNHLKLLKNISQWYRMKVCAY